MPKLKSPKQKGNRLERQVAQLIRSKLKIKAHRTPMSGAWSHMKGDIYSPEFPYAVECKNTERFNLWKYWQQTTDQATGSKTPLLVHSANHRPILCTLYFEDFLNLVKEVNELWEEKNEGN